MKRKMYQHEVHQRLHVVGAGVCLTVLGLPAAMFWGVVFGEQIASWVLPMLAGGQ